MVNILKQFISASVMTGFRQKGLLIKKTINTFFYPSWLFKLIIDECQMRLFLEDRSEYTISLQKRIFLKVFWFWPRYSAAKPWVEGGYGKLKDPGHFQEINDKIVSIMKIVALNVGGYNARILDLGCNTGRHLHILAEMGFKNLTGVDAMKEALDESSRVFVSTSGKRTLKHDLFQSFLLKQKSNSFDTIYSFSVTIEIVHPSFPIVKELCRVAKTNVILILNEHMAGWPRFWIYQFWRNRFDLVFAIRPMGSGNGSFLVFRSEETHAPDK